VDIGATGAKCKLLDGSDRSDLLLENRSNHGDIQVVALQGMVSRRRKGKKGGDGIDLSRGEGHKSLTILNNVGNYS
jgi:hypothetical protein